MTQMCCDTTARQAVHRGYAVNFLSDATGTLAVSNAARVGDGRGTAPGDPCDAADAVCESDGDGGVGERDIKKAGEKRPGFSCFIFFSWIFSGDTPGNLHGAKKLISYGKSTYSPGTSS
jgi:hypothetical protein